MTTAENLVTSLGISQKLAELGVEQGQSYFVWIKAKSFGDIKMIPVPRYTLPNDLLPSPEYKILCDAFTLSELLSLPAIQGEFRVNDLCPNKIALYLIRNIELKITNPKDLKL